MPRTWQKMVDTWGRIVETAPWLLATKLAIKESSLGKGMEGNSHGFPSQTCTSQVTYTHDHT